MANAAVRLLVSVTFAGALVLPVFVALPQELDLRTDIVGYPTHSNFNVDRYFWAYGLAVGAFPLAALALYVAFTRAFVGRAGPRGPLPPPRERVAAVPVATGRQVWVVAAARTLFVGAVLGLEAAIFAAPGRGRELAFVAVAIGYAAAVGLAAWLVSRIARRTLIDSITLANTLGAPLTVAALYLVSEATQVTVLATGAVHEYPWLPVWLAVGVTAALYVWLGLRLRKTSTHAVRNALERRALLLVAGPVVLFLTVAALPADLGTVNLFEHGQILAASELTRDGAFPWRDLLPAHGLLPDVLRGMFTLAVFEDSAWGLVAGSDLLYYPAAWIAQYYLCSFLFGANWLFLLGTQLLIVTGHVFALNPRFLLVPFVLMLLVALLQRSSVSRAVAFASLLFVQVILAPEALAAAVPCLGALILYELYYRERGAGVGRVFRRTWLVAATTAILTLAWSLFLLANHALDDWAFSFAVFVPGHRYTGGIPFLFSPTKFEGVAPVVLVLAVFAFFVAMTRLRRALALQDWAMLAMGGFTLLYYAKFLSRADTHVYQSFAAAVPLLFYAAYRAITFGEAFLARAARSRGVSWFPARHSLTLPLLLVLLVTAPVWPHDFVRHVPARFGVVATQEPQVDRIGYARQGENDIEMMADVSRALDRLVDPGGTVFDFSNAPGLFHYLLDIPSSTRYFNVSIAGRQRTQTDLIRLLEKDRPDVVVFTSDGDGLSLPAWDEVSNQVRHYDVSEYLLDDYVPVLDSHGFVLMTRRDAGGDAVPELYFHVHPCDWGYVPNFFTPGPAPGAESVNVPYRVLEAGQRLEVTLPADAAAYGWLELRTGAPLDEGRFELGDRPGGDPRRSIVFETLDRGETSVRVKVGACSQWRGYRPGTLYLTSSVPQEVREIRLVR